MNRPAIAVIASAIVLSALVLLLSRTQRRAEQLTVFCAAGLREPMEAIRKAYEAERGVRITIQYGGSNTLLANLKLSREADLFLPADDSYVDLARRDRLLSDAFAVAQMRPVVVVKRGNPLQVTSLNDLLTKEVRVSMTDPATAATGKLVRGALQSAGKWDALKSRVTVFKGTVSEVAADLQVGAADAGIVWDAMLKQLTDLEAVPIAELANVTARVVVGVVANSQHPEAAAALAEYIQAKDKGQRYFEAAGFLPATADAR